MSNFFTDKKILLVLGGSLILAILIPLNVYFAQKPTQPLITQATFTPAKLRLAPAEGNFKVDKTFEVTINLFTEEAINTVTANATYPKDLLEIERIDTADSFANIWFEKNTDTAGEIKFTGALPSPGFSGTGAFAKIVFKVIKEGEAQINFSSDSAVFRNKDSVNILGSSQNGTYTLER